MTRIDVLRPLPIDEVSGTEAPRGAVQGRNGSVAAMSMVFEQETRVVLVPHWLSAADRDALTTALDGALGRADLPSSTADRLVDVLTELHVARARDVVWPSSTARVRLVTGWDPDMLPVRLSAMELACTLSLPELPAPVRAALTGGRSA